MSSRVQGFDSTMFRVVATGTAGEPGPLSADYAFGLGADPFNDNNFPMPGGNWRWPGNTDWGAGHLGAASAFFQNRVINMSEPPADHLSVLAMNLSGIGGNGCGAFDELFLQDPFWSGSFGALANMAWVREVVGASSSILQTSGFAGTEYARKNYFPTGASPFVPGLGQVGAGMRESSNLYNSTDGLPVQVRSQGGWGDAELLLKAVQNGASGQWVTHWINDALAPAAGDGPAWWVDTDGRFGRFRPSAGVNPYQLTNDPLGAWGVRLWGTDGATFPLATPLLDVTATQGLLNGVPIATLDTAAAVYIRNVDLTTLGDKGVIVPARPGLRFVPIRWSMLVLTVTGTATGANPQLSLGVSPGFTNVAAATALQTVASINAGPGTFGATTVNGNTTTPLVANSDVHVAVQTAVTGSTVLNARIAVVGTWST